MRSSVGVAASLATACVVLVSARASAARAYGAAGPKAVGTKSLDASAQIVAPTTGGPYPLVVASHGWSASGDNQLGWAKHFASWGLVVAVPTFPSPLAPDTATNAGIIEDLVSRLEGPLASAHGVAPGAFGLEGHSAGGLATTAAAMKLAPAATVLFDPVDSGAVGKVAYAKLCAPVLAIFAGPGSCNNNGEWRGFATSAAGDLLAFDVKGSTHCDGENAARLLCGSFCGGAADATRQAVYAHYATAFLLARLAHDTSAEAALVDATVDADADLAAVRHGVSTCAKPGQDAGASDGGSTSSSSGGGADPSPSSSAEPAAGPAAPAPASEGGCSVQASGAPASSLASAALGLALGALLVRGRKRS